MKSKNYGKIISSVALLIISAISEIKAQCDYFRMEGNELFCCTLYHVNGQDTICDEWNYLGHRGILGNIDINYGSIRTRNDGTTTFYDGETGGGLGDSSNIQACEFGWKPSTDVDFGRFWFNGYSNWTSPAVLIKSQYTGSNSDVIGLKTISKYATGKGIGAQIEGGSKGINIINSGLTASKSTFGVYAISTASATATSTLIKRYGGYFSASGGTGGARYGIYATASGGAVATRYAGFFDYNVYINGSVTALQPLIIGSDLKLKEDVIAEKNALEKIMLLKPSVYHFKKELTRTMNLSASLQHGLIAQDVEKIFPELVSEITQPARIDPETEREISEEICFKGVNYIGFIPLLIQSVKEQQNQIASLKSENEILKSQLSDINSKLETLLMDNHNIKKPDKSSDEKKSSYLEQNNPNPFNESTEINYAISANAKIAVITILSTDGVVLKTYPLELRVKGNLHIPASSFDAGNYVYQLIVDGVKVDSKKMVILK